jgi:ferrous iron transport protein B
MWHKGRQYLKKMGGVIMIASIIIWFLGYYPRENEQTRAIEQQKKEIMAQNHLPKVQEQMESLAQPTTNTRETLRELNELQEHVRHEESYIGSLGKAIEPALSPLGFDWKMGVSLLSGIAAKEIVVSTMSVLYQADGTDKDGNSHLIEKIRSDTHTDGTKTFTPLVAFSFLLFTLIYFPCIAVVAAIKKESGSWKWAAFTIFYTTGLAWLISFLFYQIGQLIL